MAEMKISNTLVNDTGDKTIAYAEQLKQQIINWAEYNHVTEKLGPNNRPNTQNLLNNLFLRVYEEFLTFLNNADATDQAINTWKEIETFLAGYTDDKTLASIVAQLNANIESRLNVQLANETGDSTTTTMTQKAITDALGAKQDTITDLGAIRSGVAKVGYYECSTQGSSADKAISADNYVLSTGGSMKVKMTNANTANNATLNINSTGAKPLFYAGERASATNSWEAGETVEVYYDGTSYYANNVAGGSGDGVFDVSAKYPTSGVDGGNTYTLEGALTVLDANLSANKKKGGMSIRFVQSSDNKYVQYRLTADEFSIEINDWAIADEGVYVENSEFVYVKTDADNKILWAIRKDGDIFYGAGVPQQVVDYINKKIADLSLDEYEDIVTFLGNLIKGDTLATLLNGKVDNVTGKSLIDAEYATGISYIENPEFTAVYLDHNEKILFGVRNDGDFYFGYGVPSQIVDALNRKVNTEAGKSLISTEVADAQSIVTSEEFLKLITDEDNRIVLGIKKDGTVYIPCLQNSSIDAQLQKAIAEFREQAAALEDEIDAKMALFNEFFSGLDNPEWLEVTVDSEGKIIKGIKKDGSVYPDVISPIDKRLSALETRFDNKVFDAPENNTIIIPNEAGYVIATMYTYILEEKEIDGIATFRFSKDLGKTWIEAENFIGDIAHVHIFLDGTVLICGRRKAYTTKDFVTFTESIIYDIDGTVLTQLPRDGFYSLGNHDVYNELDGKELEIWGEYILERESNVCVWYTIDKGATIRCAFKFGESQIDGQTIICRHIHKVTFCKANNKVYVTTGDSYSSNEDHVLWGTLDATNLTWTWGHVADGRMFKLGMIWFDDLFAYIITDYTEMALADKKGILCIPIKELDNVNDDINKFHYLWNPDENTWISKNAPNSRMAPFDIIIDGNGNKILLPDYIGMGYIWIANKGWEFKRYNLSRSRVLIGNNVIGPNFNGDVYIQAFEIDKDIPFDHEHLRLNRNAGYNLTQIMRDNGVDDFMKIIPNINI